MNTLNNIETSIKNKSTASSLKSECRLQRVPKLIHFFRGNITLVSEPEFKARKKAYLGQYAWYGWFEKLFYDPAADEFVIDGNSVCLENAYDYAYKTNLEAC